MAMISAWMYPVVMTIIRRIIVFLFVSGLIGIWIH